MPSHVDEEGRKSLIIKLRLRYLLLPREHKKMFVVFPQNNFKDFYLGLLNLCAAVDDV